ncbi:MAG: S8 family serine peptidase [Gammaproteobacteria bacterium]|nr:S8 family serine peptidase [Gammaproteobacteria bacterium]MCP5424233.1 S8 family serine peptidase [Gammaproteobacteria bacterium]MCP5458893.1 S8 family serine peptidase [Gammaproteobacteria bacterium]
MPEPVLIGLIDSGVAASQTAYVAKERRFYWDTLGQIATGVAVPDRLAHGSMLADILLAYAPQARVLNAQVFDGARASTPAVIAAALDWAVAEGARVANLSLGLREDRPVLRRACEAAIAAGILLVCSVPARGGPVYPAAYAGLLRVCGDARCEPGQLSALPEGPAHLGACPHPHGAALTASANGGASLGAAHVTGLLAAFFVAHPHATRREAVQHLEGLCRFQGRERRDSPGLPSD